MLPSGQRTIPASAPRDSKQLHRLLLDGAYGRAAASPQRYLTREAMEVLGRHSLPFGFEARVHMQLSAASAMASLRAW